MSYKKKILIFGIAGQDGSYLTKLLLKSSLLEINKKNEYYTSNKIHLQKYIKNLDNETNKINVIYKKVEGMTYGRCNPIKNLGYHNISRPIRHTLCDNKYIDIDIKNCHPSILYQISLKTNLKLDFLKDYIDNRDKIFDHYYNYFSLDKDNKDHKDLIKNLFIRILYYGSYDNWKKDKKIEDLHWPSIILKKIKLFRQYKDKLLRVIQK